jgi:hypothetical protein
MNVLEDICLCEERVHGSLGPGRGQFVIECRRLELGGLTSHGHHAVIGQCAVNHNA